MYSVIFYILFIVVIIFGMKIAFGQNNRNVMFSIIMLITAVSGLHILVNSELFGLIGILTCTGIFLFATASGYNNNDETDSPATAYIIVITAGLFTALLASLVSSTRWTPPEIIDLAANSFGLIFTKYLPAVLLVTVTLSVVVSSMNTLLKNKTAKD